MTCTLRPQTGGAIAGLQLQTAAGPLELMRPEPQPAAVASHELACFPLVPFSNRIAYGRFRHNGRSVALDLPSPTTNPHAIHGDGWQSAWAVVEKSVDRARLRLKRDAGDWPWSYIAEQSFALGPEGLDATLTLTNTGNEPMPAGIGFHPYFPAPRGTRLTTGVRSVWLNGADRLPSEQVSPPPLWNFSSGVDVETANVDNCFCGWDGTARIAWPDRDVGLRIEADAVFGHVVIYAPKEADFVCVEPVSHMNDAANRPDVDNNGWRELAPGASLSGTMRLRVERPG